MAWYWWLAIILGVLFLIWLFAKWGWLGETAEVIADAIADIDFGDFDAGSD